MNPTCVRPKIHSSEITGSFVNLIAGARSFEGNAREHTWRSLKLFHLEKQAKLALFCRMLQVGAR